MTEKFNSKVLVAALDWGLGHASRCVPIIQHFTNLGFEVMIATSGMQKQFFLSEFPNHQYINLEGYNIRYTKSKRWFATKILFQVPKIIKAIISEHLLLRSITKKHNISAIISDNRYGFWHRKIPSVFITHQLSIRTPLLVKRLVQVGNYMFINQYAFCWIPDVAGPINLAGSLSHPRRLPRIKLRYLGGISRLQLTGATTVLYDVMVIISGPEPQRSFLEATLLEDLKTFRGRVLFVRGLPGNAPQLGSFNQVSIFNHLPATELSLAFEQSGMIISRSGYTTVMDIIKMKKRAILIPTPGQTEQEYLAEHLKSQYWCYTTTQHQFKLQAALSAAETFPYCLPDINMEEYKLVINEFVSNLHG
ncbi:glycosyl transferase family 28 [Segetibacter sp. 3557_3]|uniref:glycosyltransferase n=1 Tax=Segetibacter sp. 3557_3 TaxID=2547429 RepID=UPI001058AE78|nr:glycosyltransferase [Segetibacter sp. 3557_3]TDH20870.1 glycosyl transferase family 28 [Segetibacter sp. 3557_3]